MKKPFSERLGEGGIVVLLLAAVVLTGGLIIPVFIFWISRSCKK